MTARTRKFDRGPEPLPVFQATELCIRDDHGRLLLRNVRLRLFSGSIVGIAGISGNGQRELTETLVGLRDPVGGKIVMGVNDLTGKDPRHFVASGIGFISEDPIRDSLVPGFTVLEHMSLGGIPIVPRGAGIHWQAIREKFLSSETVRKLGVADAARKAARLSGGNIQRMMLARALLAKPTVLIVSYPSRGLDIGTTRRIQRMLRQFADDGAAILLISEELTELYRLSDQIAVLHDGELLGPYDPDLVTMQQVGSIMLKGESA